MSGDNGPNSEVESLQTAGLYPDVSFKIGTTHLLKAHKDILMKRSKVFAKIFNSSCISNEDETSEGPRTVNVLDKSPQSFEHFLTYLYTDELPQDLGVHEGLDILDLANSYEIPELYFKCSEFLKFKISVDSCVEIYQRTQLYPDKELNSIAFHFINKNISLVAESDQFLHFQVEELQKLMQGLDPLVIDELSLFKALLRWGNAGRYVKDGTGQEKLRKEVMKELIRTIQFMQISPKDFAREVVPTKVFSDEKALEIISYLNGGKRVRMGRKPTETWDEFKCFPKMTSCFPMELRGIFLKPPIHGRDQCPAVRMFPMNIKMRKYDYDLIPQFRFRCSEPIKIRGFKMFGAIGVGQNSEKEMTYQVQFCITRSEDVSTTPWNDHKPLGKNGVMGETNLWSGHGMVTKPGNFEVFLEEPFETIGNQVYLISASLAVGIPKECKDPRKYCRVVHGVRKQEDDVFVAMKSQSGNVTFDISHNELCLPAIKKCGGSGLTNFETLSRKKTPVKRDNLSTTRIGIVHSIIFTHSDLTR